MKQLLADQDLSAAIHTIFEQRIPFNKYLGLRVVSVDPREPVIRVGMRDELVGNFVQGGLHGGVTSAILDVTGGLVAFLNVTEKLVELSDEEKLHRFAKLGTIDLRVDYLRPGRGDHFLARGFILRTGNKVAVTRMELHNDADQLIAVGTGAYTVS
ncbi:MAG: thioesterase family protein [Gammaproteobacteria bacterium]|nr:thioesterase family protein [Gammaproteobacteria bacterium]